MTRLIRQSKRRKWIYAAALLAVVLAGYIPGTNLILALRLLLAIRGLALGETGQGLPVVESVIHLRSEGKELEALLYLPSRSLPTRAIVLSPGISELGWHHPQLIALSRFLADCGFLVLTPDLQKFREFQISAEPVEEMVFWARAVPALQEARQVRHIGFAGISFSGTMALIAAARPEVRDSTAFVLGIGSYFNLQTLTHEWFAPETETAGKGYYPTRFYARWLIMQAALGILPMENERQFLHTVLNDLLRQNKVPPSDPPGLSPEGLRWYSLAVNETQSDPILAAQIENNLRPLLDQKLDPTQAAGDLRCPVFLVHGAYDDLISPDQSRQLKHHIERANSYLLITPFLTHTHALEKPLSRSEKLRALLAGFGFLYNFARVLR